MIDLHSHQFDMPHANPSRSIRCSVSQPTRLYDGYSAGIYATMLNIDRLLEGGINVRVVALPTNYDPDSFARTHSAEQVREYIETNSKNFLKFKANTLL